MLPKKSAIGPSSVQEPPRWPVFDRVVLGKELPFLSVQHVHLSWTWRLKVRRAAVFVVLKVESSIFLALRCNAAKMSVHQPEANFSSLACCCTVRKVLRKRKRLKVLVVLPREVFWDGQNQNFDVPDNVPRKGEHPAFWITVSSIFDSNVGFSSFSNEEMMVVLDEARKERESVRYKPYFVLSTEFLLCRQHLKMFIVEHKKRPHRPSTENGTRITGCFWGVKARNGNRPTQSKTCQRGGSCTEQGSTAGFWVTVFLKTGRKLTFGQHFLLEIRWSKPLGGRIPFWASRKVEFDLIP